MKEITGNVAFAFAVGVLILLNTELLALATMVMSEMPYMFFTCLAFWAMVKLGDRKDFWRSPYFYTMVLSAVMAYYTRSIALALMGAIFLHFLIQRRWLVSLAFLGSAFVLYLPWIIRE